jgi:hypothetical protein
MDLWNMEEEKISNFIILKVMKSTFTTKFNHLLLSTLLIISFEDLNFLFCIRVLNIVIEVIME